MRYFIHLSYDGTNYAGWQSQPNAIGVQSVIEDRLNTILNRQIKLTGCGRTDAGVHASDFYAHFDCEKILPENLVFRLNNFLPSDISIYSFTSVKDDAHVRFDAIQRSYIYHIHFIKDPFKKLYSFYYQKARHIGVEVLNEFTQRLLDYSDFKPFSKLHTDVKTFRCNLNTCHWTSTKNGMELHVTSDRFLRGMIRLITGASLYYAEGKITIDELDQAMQSQQRLQKNWSVPACGLFLSEIVYPESIVLNP
ncbi:tRNA pseudouridine synthase A [Membranihabitans maritimus]|uniref:tRNA pseudouridine synthase A n=1 Tax=Membranihabitans maritimus TaxID=2904244 RepID=UPI001F264ABE|nr:tRNA pseudouridine synthase A [Membranihabitans maritimus]